MRSPSVPLDTDRDVLRRQLERWRSMTAIERAEIADRLSVDVTAVAVAGIQFDMPGAGPELVRRELARRRYGRTFAEATFGVAPLT